ncbi:hypothetical protein GWI33_021187 [Rhynchophorus ferrugineus]|uniref:Uncharacterized protein n=1 Tax=Rhynchophorus ferrugineus TaxID=354439 RepID=A0A834I1S5_RHYFE|nr:hypothetical protein GWI33_021187 [Rhynchophorus ferrugineus]
MKQRALLCHLSFFSPLHFATYGDLLIIIWRLKYNYLVIFLLVTQVALIVFKSRCYWTQTISNEEGVHYFSLNPFNRLFTLFVLK